MSATKRHSLSKYFGRGAGHATRYHGSDVILVRWHGRADGHATAEPDGKSYSRAGVAYKSLAALLRGIEAEHARD